MQYHVLMHIEDDSHWWTNLDFDTLTTKIVIPFMNKQIVPVNYGTGKAILNLATATYLRIFRTDEPFPEEGFNFTQALNASPTIADECTQEIIDQFLVTNSALESRSLLQTLFMPTKPQVFVIMKFGDKHLDSAYEGVIKPVVKKYKYRPLRIDEVQDSGRITNQILEEIAQSQIVLADLSGERPNCYYEAGFAHAIGKELIFTIHRESAIHFDLAGYRFIEWETEDDLRKGLLKRFRAIKHKN